MNDQDQNKGKKRVVMWPAVFQKCLIVINSEKETLMKNFKKFCMRTWRIHAFLLAICIVVVCTLTACGSNEESQSADSTAGVNTEATEKSGDNSADTSDATTWEELYQGAMNDWRADNYEGALDVLEQAIETEPMAESLYLLRARVYKKMAEEIEVSEETVETVLEMYEKALADTEKAEELINSGEAVEDDDRLEDDLTSAVNWNSMISYAISSAKAEVKNSYGSTVFQYRSSYQEFDEFTAAQQAWLEDLINACINQSVNEVVMEGLDSIFDSRKTCYTIWGQYKIWFSIDVYSETSAATEIEIRPENGTGYYASIVYDPEGSKSSKEIIYTTSTCVDWQWNGEYISEYIWTPPIIEIEEWGEEEWVVTTSGTMKESLRTGTFTSDNGTYYIYDENGKVTDAPVMEEDGNEYYGTIRYERQSFTETYGSDILYWCQF